MRKRLKIILIPVVIIFLLPLSALIFFTLTAYNPEKEISLSPVGHPHDIENENPGDLSILSWNTGYAGLDEKTDFFMEGGTMSRAPDRETVVNSLEAIGSFLKSTESDIYLLQEIDGDSDRSWRIDQISGLSGRFPEYEAWYAPNFRTSFVPIPVGEPIGRVESGLMTLSRYKVSEAIQYRLPGKRPWPVRIFHLKRCALLTRIPSASPGKEWCIFNIHLSAYEEGSMRRQQMEYLKNLASKLYEEGHYVVLGGDWNSLFPGVGWNDFAPYTTDDTTLEWMGTIPPDWTMNGWQWCFDDSVPTMRSLDRPYLRGENFETIIDGFLVSPNIEIREVRGFDLLFRDSDHNPVSVTLRAGE